MSIHRLALAASAALFVTTVAVGSASAMPLDTLRPAAQATQVTPQNVGWYCGPYRCFWGPGPYWGPRRFWWGPRHHWRRWW